MNAKEANRRSRQGQAAAEKHEPTLRDKYEAALRANAKRVAGAYRKTGINVDGEGVSDRKKARGITAAARVPTLDEVLADATLAKSATARTKVERQRIAEEAAHPIITEAGKRELRALLEPLVAAQAGVQAERIVAGVRDRVAAIMLEALTEGYSVPDTAALLQANLELDAVWQAEMLARTDLISLSNAGSHAAAASLEDGPKFKTWLSAGDNRVRPTHVDANRQTVPIDKPYKLAEGVELQYPGDPAGPDGETINCRCLAPWVPVAGAEVLTAMRRPFEGHLWRITTATGREISVTAEHPILTGAGWKPAEFVQTGDDLVCAVTSELAFPGPHVDDVPSRVDEVFRTLEFAGTGSKRIDRASVNLHGHIPDSDVEVVRAHDALSLEGNVALGEQCRELVLSLADREMRLAGDSASFVGVEEPNTVSFGTPTDESFVGGKDAGDAAAFEVEAFTEREHAFAGVVATEDFVGDGSVASQGGVTQSGSLVGGDPGFLESFPHGCEGDAVLVSDLLHGSPGLVEIDPVVDVVVFPFSGHVFNLSTAAGCYLADGIVTANCVSVFTDSPAPGLSHSRDGGIHDEPVTAFDAPVAAAGIFDPAKHPRHGKGVREGGRFATVLGKTVEVSKAKGMADFTDSSTPDRAYVAQYLPPLPHGAYAHVNAAFRLNYTDARSKSLYEVDGPGFAVAAKAAETALEDLKVEGARVAMAMTAAGTRVPIPNIGTVAAGFDPLKHPRYQRGDERGGQFSPKDGTSTATATKEAEQAATQNQEADAAGTSTAQAQAQAEDASAEAQSSEDEMARARYQEIRGNSYELGKLTDAELADYIVWADRDVRDAYSELVPSYDEPADPVKMDEYYNRVGHLEAARLTEKQRAADVSYMADLAAQPLQPGEVGRVRRMDLQSTNPVYLGELDGQKVVVKPKNQLSPTQLRTWVEPGFDLEREQAAAHVASLIDDPDVAVRVPAYRIDDVNGYGRAGVADFVEGQTMAQAYRTAQSKEGSSVPLGKWGNDLENVRLYDGIIGNTDRHEGNLMIDPSGRIHAIDHGLAFPSENQEGFPNVRGGASVVPLTDDQRATLERLRPRVVADTVLPTLLTDSQRAMMQRRIDFMLANNRLPTNDDWRNGWET